MTVGESLIAKLLGDGVIGLIKALWTRRDRPRKWWNARQLRRADKRTAKRRSKQLAEAKATGQVIAVAHAGYQPTKVTFSDDSVSFYFNGNLDAYRRGMNSGQYPVTRTFHGRPPALPS